MRRNSGSFRNSGAYTSPGTPEYGNSQAGDIPKTWSSERVPLPTNSSSRRYIGAAAMPFYNGRTLPSKWDDAERWITSPVSGYGAFKTSNALPQRRPKSKSGPLVPPGIGYLSNYSPTMPLFEGRKMRNFMANSPLTTGVFAPDGLSVHYDAAIAMKSNSLFMDNDMLRGTSVPGLSDLLSETSVPSSQDDKLDEGKEEEGVVSRVVSRRDMATQMSPEGSTRSSSKGRLSFSTLPSIPNSICASSNAAAKDEVRDVQIDKGTPSAMQFKKHETKRTKDTANFGILRSLSDVGEASKNSSRVQREEAKIDAWENLQKAKAEAEIRKLEMKLEKKRSASMDKIMNKLKAAQMKAQARRSLLSENHHARHNPRTSHRRFSLCCMSRFVL